MNEHGSLVQRAIEIQKSYRMSDATFARKVIGISPSLWCMVKSGKRPATGAFALGIIGRFPELALLLPRDSTIVNDNRKTA